MIQGSIYTDRRNFNFDNAEPQFGCSTPECQNASWHEDDYAQCEVCLKRHCPDCTLKFEHILFCKACALCDSCKAPATGLCVECGDLVCAEHSTAKGASKLCTNCDSTARRVA